MLNKIFEKNQMKKELIEKKKLFKLPKWKNCNGEEISFELICGDIPVYIKLYKEGYFFFFDQFVCSC